MSQTRLTDDEFQEVLENTSDTFEDQLSKFGKLVTAEQAFLLCKKHISKEGKLIKKIFHGNPLIFLDDESYKKLCFIALEDNKSALKHIPKFGTIKSFLPEDYLKMYLICMKSAGSSMPKKIPKPDEESFLSVDDYITIYMEGVKLNGRLLEDIPKPYQFPENVKLNNKTYQNAYADIAFAAVRENWSAAEFLPLPEEGKLSPPLSLDDYMKIYDAAIEQSGAAIRTVVHPKSHPFFDNEIYINFYKRICLEAVKKYSGALSCIPKPHIETIFSVEEYIEIYTYAAKFKKFGLDDLPKPSDFPFLNNEKYISFYKNICINLVKENSLQLEFVDETCKIDVIEAISPERILLHNYGAYKFFPQVNNLEDRIKFLLENINNIVIVTRSSLSDFIVMDSCKTFLDKKGKQGKTILVTTDDLTLLLNELKKYHHSLPLSITLSGHSGPDYDDIADLTMKDVVEILAKNSNIDSVRLLGCYTGLAKRFEEEEKLLQSFIQTDSKWRDAYESNASVWYLQEPLGIQHLSTLEKLLTKSDGVYTLCKNNESDYQLTYVTINTNKKNDTEAAFLYKTYTLNDAQLKSIQGLFASQLQAADKSNTAYCKEKLTYYEKIEMREILDDEQTLTKTSSKYQLQKANFPPFKNKELDEKEIQKLNNSLFKQLIELIKKDPRLKNKTYKIKVYFGIVSPDTFLQGFQVTNERIFTDNYSQSFFCSKKPNVDSGKLKRKRVELIEESLHSETQESKKKEKETTYKSGSFTLKT